VTTTAIRKVPTSLPHARIFLDDLFEIENLLTVEFSKLYEGSSITFEYAIDETIAMTTHQELIDHGGYTNQFSLSVLSGAKYLATGSLIFNGSMHPLFSVPYDLRSNEWAIFGKIEQIFNARKDRIKCLHESVPSI
jgi:hypothetical protein